MSSVIMSPGTETAVEKILPTTLDEAHEKIKELYHFIEMTDALTYDQATSARIRSFLKKEGVWN